MIYRRRENRVGGVKLAILFSLLCGAGLAAAAWFLLPPRYESFASVLVHNQAPVVLRSSEGTVDFQTAKNNAMAMLTSKLVAEKALDDPAGAIKDLPVIKRQGIDAADWLADALQATNGGGGEWIRVSLVSEDSEGLDKIVDAVVNAYMSEVVEREWTEKLTLRDSLNRKLQNYKNALASKMRDLYGLSTQLGASDSQAAKASIQIEVDQLQELMSSRKEILHELAEAKMKKELMAALAEDAKAHNTIPEDEIEETILHEPHVVELTKELSGLNRQLREAQRKVNGAEGKDEKDAKEADLKHIREQISDVQEEIDQARSEQRQSFIVKLMHAGDQSAGEMKVLDLQIAIFKKQVDAVTDEIRKQAENVHKLDRYNGDAELLKADVEELSGIIHDMEVTLERRNIELDADSRVERGSPAIEARPIEPLRRPIGTALAGFAGFSLAMIFAVLIHLLRK